MARPLDRPGNPQKAALRSEMIPRRDALPAPERERIAAALTQRLVAMPQYAAARAVLATMSIGSEWSTAGFLARASVDRLRSEAHDVPVDLVLDERGTDPASRAT